jgi:uncharacterized RDD family membrane protein YckC
MAPRRLRIYDAHETSRMQAVHGLPLASFGARAAAFAIDFAIAGVLFVVTVAAGGGALVRLGVIHPEGDVTLRMNFFDNWYSVVWLVAYFTLATWIGGGRTPGKRLLGIRVVSLVHDHLSLWHAFERALGYAASALEFGFGFAQYFIHPNRRTVHDRIAETIVVTERVRAAPPAAAIPAADAGATEIEPPAHAQG